MTWLEPEPLATDEDVAIPISRVLCTEDEEADRSPALLARAALVLGINDWSQK